jgi:formylglycine-generating enzyme required for sulfatase activity
LTGAYEVSQFWDGPNASIGGEQASHNPGAKYWIPSLDEWLKAGYYDPTKGGTGGWWQSPDASDRILVSGRPGVGDFNGGGDIPFWERDAIPLMSYGHIRSYYGLYDVLGGTTEYLEDLNLGGRLTAGTAAADGGLYQPPDALGGAYSRISNISNGLRLASAIPNLGTVSVMMGAGVAMTCKRRRLP